jgi:hypothetical protein
MSLKIGFRTLYLNRLLDDGDLQTVESAVRAEGHDIELAEVMCDQPAINVHRYTYRSEGSLRYWLNVAGVQIVEVA